MKLTKRKIWVVSRRELNENDKEVSKVLSAYTTQSEAMHYIDRRVKSGDILQYAVRSVWTWFPK
jgi:hypothetical protein